MMTDSPLNLRGNSVTNSFPHGNNSLFSPVSSADVSGILSANSSTFDEIEDLFDNVTVHVEMFNGTDRQESPVSQTTYHCQLYRFIMSVGLTGSLCIFGIVGNILTLLVFSKFNKNSSDLKHRSSAPLLLSGLAVSDLALLVSLFIMKTVPSFLSFTEIFPEFFTIYAFLLVYGWPCVGVSQSVNTWITVLVAMHRFIAIIFPHKAAIHCTYNKARIHLVIVTLTVTVYELPTFFDNNVVRIIDSRNKTAYIPTYGELNLNHWYQLVYKTSLYYIIMYLIPWIILAIVTGFLTRAVKQAQKFRSQMGNNHQDNTEDITTSLIAVVVTSLICRPWEPVRRVMEALLGIQPGCGHYYYYYEEFPSLTSALNSSANFVLYCLFGKRFPDTLKEIFRLRKSDGEVELKSVGTVVTNMTNEKLNEKL